MGGWGDNTLTGFAGSDVYGVNTLLDVVVEAAAGGTGDSVESGYIGLDLNLFANV